MQLIIPSSAPRVPRELETIGLATVLLEAGLGDLPDVVPSVGDLAPSPGLSAPLGAEEERWTGTLVLSGAEPRGTVVLSLSLCDAETGCQSVSAVAPPAQMVLGVAGLLDEVALLLGRRPTPEVAAAWRAPLSTDTYALLMLGRAGAITYGLLPPIPEEKIGDRRADPIVRTGYVDPKIPHSFWLKGRREVARGELDVARLSFDRATLARPISPTLLAGEAYVLNALEKHADALLLWEQLEGAVPGDPRFLAGQATTLLALGKAEEAARLLANAARGVRETREVLSLRVEATRLLARTQELDPLLARWQARVPRDPEPVRQRVALRVWDDRFREALTLIPELVKRDPESPEPGSLQVALEAAVATEERGRLELPVPAGTFADPALLPRVGALAAQ